MAKVWLLCGRRDPCVILEFLMQPAPSLFTNIPPTDYFKLFKKNEEPPIDGQKVVHILDYKKSDVAVASGVSENSVRYDERMPKEVVERMREWAVAINLVGNYFKDEQKTMLWF